MTDWERYQAAKKNLTPEQIERIKAKCQWEHMTWFAVFLGWPNLFEADSKDSAGGGA